MVKPEENGQENSKRKSQENVACTHIPKVDKPTPARSRHKGDASRENIKLNLRHATNVDEAGKEDEGQGRAIIFEKDTQGMAKEAAGAKLTAGIGNHEDQEGGNDGEIKLGAIAQTLENLNTLLEVDEGDVKAKDVAREASDPTEPIARIGDGKNPV